MDNGQLAMGTEQWAMFNGRYARPIYPMQFDNPANATYLNNAFDHEPRSDNVSRRQYIEAPRAGTRIPFHGSCNGLLAIHNRAAIYLDLIVCGFWGG